MVDFVHLHVHSYYSLLDGLSSPKDLVKRAKNLGMTALALTDHGVMYGAVEFYLACKAQDIKPIIGVEAYVASQGRLNKSGLASSKYNHLILLAKNFTGYQNLLRLTTLAHTEGFYYKPRIDHELLAEYGEGLIGLSACLKGEIPEALINDDFDKAKKLLVKYQSFFAPGDFYLEIQNHEEIPLQQVVNEKIIKLANETGTKLVATNDVHYVAPEDRNSHDVLLCIQTGKTVHDTNRMRYNGVFALYSQEDMESKFKDNLEALTNTCEVAMKCDLEIPLNQHLLPEYKLPAGISSIDYLRDLCEQGLKERYENSDYFDKAKSRLNFELETIFSMGFATYFLIVWDFIRYAKEENIFVGPGRGSAAGSIVAYCLKITDVDPLKYNLLFERFLNPERISMPDIDIDFADNKREKVLDYVVDKYGHENVAQIITFGTMGAKAAIRDCGRALGVSYGYVDKVAKMIPMRPGITIAEALTEEFELKDLYEHDHEAKELIDTALKLEGVVRHSSTHACAVVIAEKSLLNYTPLQKGVRGETTLITQYSMKPIEQIGILKMDFLGLKNLTILERTCKIIKRTQNKIVDLDRIPLDCKKTFLLLSRAETIGIFQLESGGMRRYLKSLKPSNFEDIIAMVSLYRPGSLDMKVSGNKTMVDIYIDRKNGKIKESYLDPCLESILKSTYGVIIYQEQILKIAQEFAGFSLGEADLLRRAIGKKIKEEVDAQKIIFISKAEKNGKQKALAEKLFSYIEPFARYGFNKSHAACYAMIAYQTAYLKAHFPVEFLASCLTCDIDNNERLAILMEDAARLKIKILPPSVNESLKNFTVTEDRKNIRFGLAAIKNIGEGPAEAIIQARKEKGKFISFEDFLIRLGTKFSNKKVLESLAKCGALDDLIERNELIENLEYIISFSKAVFLDTNDNQADLFSMSEEKSEASIPKLNLRAVEPASNFEKLKWEKELIGMYVSTHPLMEYKSYFENNLRLMNELGSKEVNKVVRIGGMVSQLKTIFTKKGDKMCFFTLEDYSGSLEVVVFNGVYKSSEGLIQVDNLLVCSGKLKTKEGGMGYSLILDKVEILDPKKALSAEAETIPRTEDDNSEKSRHLLKVKILTDSIDLELPASTQMEDLVAIKNLLAKHQGNKIFNLIIPNLKSNSKHAIRVPFLVDFSDELHTKLDQLFLK